MLYSMPKKIQLAPSQAKWQLSSTQSVLVLVGLQKLAYATGHTREGELMVNLIQLTNKAKALDIPIVDLYGDDLQMQGMQQLGEYASTHPQLIFARAGYTDAETDFAASDGVTINRCSGVDVILLANLK